MKQKSLGAILLIMFCAVILAFGLRGLPGSPTADMVNTPAWKEKGPLELSPERGRYALTYSIIEDHSLQFSIPVARFATPDLGVTPEGKYVSLFAPGVSFLVAPGYWIGKYMGIAQVGTFAVIALFALANALLIAAIAVRLGVDPRAGALGALTFLFATPAFSYAVTLYQHHISVFLILISLYALIRWDTFWSFVLVWFFSALSVVVDNPNFFFMLPIALAALAKAVFFERKDGRWHVHANLFGVFALYALIPPILFFLWFNNASHGDPLKLSGTLQSVQNIGADGRPVYEAANQEALLSEGEVVQHKKTAVNFFKTRNLLNGFYEHFISPDRGIIYFTPVMLMGILGMVMLYRVHVRWGILFLAIIGANVLLYSMWGDPWGGWAFGSRYLIPSYALLAIGVAYALSRLKNNYVLLLVFAALFSYSVYVNAVGAITSNTNPPQAEVLALEKVTHKQEKYTYERNIDERDKGEIKSFVFQTIGKKYVTPRTYHLAIAGAILLAGLFLITRLVLRAPPNRYGV